MAGLKDKDRSIDYLRISLTDRCDLRCVYCMGADGIENKLGRDAILSLEEVLRFARLACAEGIKYIRLTGGEPLVRLGIVDLVKGLSQIPQLEDLSMTSNGQLFARHASALREAGLSRVTFSLDSTNGDTYRELTRGGDIAKVYAAIDEALSLGYALVKINALAYQLTEDDLRQFIHMVQEKSVHVRFIEYMPLGHMGRELRKYPSPPVEKTGSLLSMADVKGAIDRLAAQEGLGRLSPLAGGEAPLGHGPARSYAFPCDNVAQRGSFGFIGIHSQKFCARCNRLRLTADGKIRSCLFSDSEISVSEALRTNDQEALREGLLQAVASKPRSYKQQQGTQRAMSAIGG